MSAVVVALLEPGVPERDLAAGFEEESVPLAVERRRGAAAALAAEAASLSALGIGVGGDSRSLALALSTRPREIYLLGQPGEARAFGRAAARLAARRPLWVDAEATGSST